MYKLGRRHPGGQGPARVHAFARAGGMPRPAGTAARRAPVQVNPAAGRCFSAAAEPCFEFTDPPFRHSLPMTLAFAATASGPPQS
jgi:hypothetical protein